MAGETIKAKAICLAIHPWSRTSHITTWLTPHGILSTIVKGAVRPKSAFLGQYDLNYTCDIVYYAREKGDLHALRECCPCERRDALRHDFRRLVLADWFRHLTRELAPSGPEATVWFNLLDGHLSNLAKTTAQKGAVPYLQMLLDYELAVLHLSGLTPEIIREDGALALRGERRIPISPPVKQCLENPRHEADLKILVDTARVISVYYTFHLDCAPTVRRTVLRMILQ